METDLLHISLSPTMKEFVERQVQQGGYGGPGDYILALIGDAQKRSTEQNLESLLLQAARSESSEMRREDWEEIRREGLQRITAAKTS